MIRRTIIVSSVLFVCSCMVLSCLYGAISSQAGTSSTIDNSSTGSQPRTEVNGVYYMRDEPHDILDQGSLLKAKAQDSEITKCHSFILFPFSEIGNYTGFTNVTSIYYHWWMRVSAPINQPQPWHLHRFGYSISRAHDGTMNGYMWVDANFNKCQVGDYAVVIAILQTDQSLTSFDGEAIYNFTMKDYSGWPELLNSPHQASFVYFNMSSNSDPDGGLSQMDSDRDGLDDSTELYQYFTNPEDPDTDADGATDYEEVTGASHGHWNSDPNNYLITTDYRVITVNIGGPYTGIVGEDIQFNGSAIGGIPPYTYLWDFGDGNISTEKNPIHRYSTEGTFYTLLTVSDQIHDTAHNYTMTSVVKVQPPTAVILKPDNGLYFFNKKILALKTPLIIGNITIEVNAVSTQSELAHVDFSIDGRFITSIIEPPYHWEWKECAFFSHTIKVTVFDMRGYNTSTELQVRKFF